MISPIFVSLRPKQWIKNLLVFAALFFSEKGLIFSWEAWVYTVIGFMTFCGLSGSVYILNDLIDVSKDRLHPVKSLRPLASGQLSVKDAKASLLLILIISLFVAWKISGLFFGVALGYFMLNLAYSFKLKRIVILDVMCIALGFVLRAVAGVGALKTLSPEIYISHWLVLATFMLAMFLGLAKRRQEIVNHEENAVKQRGVLADYSPEYIDQMTSILATVAIITYTFYTVSSDTVTKFGTTHLVYTVPIALYGILRYLYLIHLEDEGENPTDLIIGDKPLFFCGIIWILSAISIIHYFH